MTGRAASPGERWAVVTGGSSGLGRAVAVELGRRGRRVALLARDPARLDEAAAAVVAAGGKARAVRGDVADARALREALDAAVGDAGVDLLVHAAGVLEVAPLPGFPEAALRRMLEVNVVGTANTVGALLPRLQATRGHVAVVSSVAGLFPLPGGFTGYAASKWALRGWAETARPELDALGVSLTIAYPSILDTPMVRELGADAPAVYRAFPWHPPERAARRLVDDALEGRLESYVTGLDRLGAWMAGAFPHLFAAAFRTWVALRAR